MNFLLGFYIILLSLSPCTCSSNFSPTVSIASLPGNLVENLAVRANGQILVTSSAPSANLWQIDPLRIRDPLLVATFPGVSGTLGIVEFQPDVFYVAAGNVTFDGTTVSPPTAFSVWRVDMTSFRVSFNGTIVSPAKISRFVDMPSHASINGITSTPLSAYEPSFLFAADSVNGLVWSISLPVNGIPKVFVAINDTTMLPPSSQGFGINGIKYFNSSIYYTNSAASTLHIHAIDPKTGLAPLSSTAVLLANITLPDDLILDIFNPNFAFVCSQGLGAVLRVDLASGSTIQVASNFSGPSAVAWGHDLSDESSLYLTTNGGIAGVLGGMAGQGVSRIDLGDAVL